MCSLSVNFFEKRKGLFVSDHALVGALELVEVQNVDIGDSALVKASGVGQAVEQVLIQADVLKVILRRRGHKVGPQRHIAFSSTHFIRVVILI